MRWPFPILPVFLSLAVACATGAEQEPVQAAIIGRFAKGPVGAPVRVNSVQFESLYGSSNPVAWPAELQARRFFAQQGAALHVIRANPGGSLKSALEGDALAMSGRHALPLIRDFGVLICPELTQLPAGEVPGTLQIWRDAMKERRAMLILDPPPGLTTVTAMTQWTTQNAPSSASSLAIYYPYLTASINGTPASFGASGSMAAAWLKNDSLTGEGIWSSPAGTQLPLVADNLSTTLNTTQQDALAAVYICPIIKPTVSGNIIPWGIRHLDGGNPENRYISLQRTLNWIGTNVTRLGSISASRSNNSALWIELRGNVQSFLQEIYQRGALQGATASQAYFVQCGLGQTMTQADVDSHVVKLMIGVAMTRPSEFTIVQFSWDTRNPARPLAAPRLIMRDGYAGKQLFYSTPPGATYSLKSSATMTAGTWFEHAAPVTGDGTWRQAQFEPLFGRRFFRSEQTALP
jgi:hypothetical protein